MDDIRKNIDELVSKIEDGDSRFVNSAMLNQCVQALARGAEPIGIVTNLIDIIEEQQKHLIKYITLYGANNKE